MHNQYGDNNSISNSGNNSSGILVKDKVTASNDLDYQSNPKHTLGQQGNRNDTGIEPKNSLELLE